MQLFEAALEAKLMSEVSTEAKAIFTLCAVFLFGSSDKVFRPRLRCFNRVFSAQPLATIMTMCMKKHVQRGKIFLREAILLVAPFMQVHAAVVAA